MKEKNEAIPKQSFTKIGMSEVELLIEENLKVVSDFPKPGIEFFDMSSLFCNVEVSTAISKVIKREAEYTALNNNYEVDAIVGIDARGFVVGAQLAKEMNLPLLLVRKAGKLPPPVFSTSYDLEYGSAVLEIAEKPDSTIQNVVIIDDVYATGGSMRAAAQLCEKAGYYVVDRFAVLGVKELYNEEDSENVKIISIR